jgi:S-formylglutathione hydrolase FrmB
LAGRRRGVARLLAVVTGIVVAALLARAVLTDDGFSGDTRGAKIERFDVDSELLGDSRRQTIVRPAGGSEGRPLLLFLHGRGNDSDSNLTGGLFDGLRALGDRAPAIAFADGGDYSYYHDRDDGPWGSYVVEEVLPAALRRTGADPDRVAIGGISMGGFGAFDVARFHPDRFCAVGGHSAALWESADQTPEGAFDGADDFAGHDVIAAARADAGAFGDVPIWIDGGEDDPFRSAEEALASALQAGGADVQLHHWPGGHEGEYWETHMPAYLRFYARALADCHR